MSTDSWPPQLKEWVAKCLGQMNDGNRAEAQAELRQIGMVSSYKGSAKRVMPVVMNSHKLYSLLPKSIIGFNNLKRKSVESVIATKKMKKAQKQAHQNSTNLSDQLALNRRAHRFQREHDIERQKSMNNGTVYGGLATSKADSHMFNRAYSRPAFHDDVSMEPEVDPNVPNWDKFTIVGASQEMFKDYLRLTTEPKPEQIRPYAVLKATLAELKNRWRDGSSYAWVCNQFKSLRQDLTVQRIKNDFTVQVYEIHARMALESGDMVEYNQCQSTLKTLYELGIPGQIEEFTAYQILMLLHGRNRSELNLFVGQLTPKQKADPVVQHALKVLRAMSMGNYHALFQLYEAPKMGAYIMDHFIDRERIKALLVITKAYKTLPLSFLQTELAFDDAVGAHGFLAEHNCAFFSNPNDPDSDKKFECKLAAPQLAQTYEEKFRRVGIKGAI